MSERDELHFIEELNRLIGIVDELKKTSPEVIRLMHRLQESISAYETDIARRDLSEKIEAALYQGGFGTEIASAFAHMMAYRDVEIVLVEHGD